MEGDRMYRVPYVILKQLWNSNVVGPCFHSWNCFMWFYSFNIFLLQSPFHGCSQNRCFWGRDHVMNTCQQNFYILAFQGKCTMPSVAAVDYHRLSPLKLWSVKFSTVYPYRDWTSVLVLKKNDRGSLWDLCGRSNECILFIARERVSWIILPITNTAWCCETWHSHIYNII